MFLFVETILHIMDVKGGNMEKLQSIGPEGFFLRRCSQSYHPIVQHSNRDYPFPRESI